jgi:hypothetical protein
MSKQQQQQQQQQQHVRKTRTQRLKTISFRK